MEEKHARRGDEPLEPHISGKPTDGPISKTINCKISTRITSYILSRNLPVTPNQISLLSFLTAAAASLLYVARLPALAGVLVQTSSIIDGVDGEFARARRISNPVGAFVDSVLDRLADALIIISLTIIALDKWGLYGLFTGFAALLGSLMVSYVHSQGMATLRTHVSRIGRIPMYASRDVRLFIIFLGSVVGAHIATLAVVAILSLSYVLLKTLDVYVAWRRAEIKAELEHVESYSVHVKSISR